MLKWTERCFLASRLTLRKVKVCGEKKLGAGGGPEELRDGAATNWNHMKPYKPPYTSVPLSSL